MSRLARVGMIARWKPVHLGHAAILEALCDSAEHAVIGIGSSNRYDARNPFTARETEAMIRLVLGERPGYELVRVPDLGHGPRWAAMVRELLAPLDLYVTENAFDRGLLEAFWPVVHPVTLVPPARRVAVDGTMVRRAIARGEDWARLVPAPVATYLEREGLIARFRAEFGPATLAGDAPVS